jgi:hypothetical protein
VVKPNPEEVNGAKNALIRYCGSQQSSHGALTIGFSVALFTLLGIVQSSLQKWLSSFLLLDFLSFDFWRMICLLAGLEVLLTMLFYTFMRYWFYGYFSSSITGVEPSEIAREPIHREIASEATRMIDEDNKKILLRLPAIWFFSGTIYVKGERRKAPRWKGIATCAILALLAALYLVFLS